MEERRRVPRHDVGEEFTDLPARVGVRVLDISTAGVLLQSAAPLTPGARGSLRFTLAGAPFSAEIQVRRAAPAASAGAGYRIGASFVGMTLEDRHMIERFMSND
jgi:hypothetical protein